MHPELAFDLGRGFDKENLAKDRTEYESSLFAKASARIGDSGISSVAQTAWRHHGYDPFILL